MDNSVDTISTNRNGDTNYDYELMADIVLNLDISYAHNLFTHQNTTNCINDAMVARKINCDVNVGGTFSGDLI